MGLNFKFKLLTAASRFLVSPVEKIGPIRARAELRKATTGPALLMGRMPELADVRDDTLAGVAVRRYLPHGAKAGTVVFFHGGGWVLGDIAGYDILAATLAADSGHEVVSVEYRLAPEHPHPAGLDDCLAVTQALAAVGKVAVAGDSSGGNLAAVVANRLPVVAQLLFYPATEAAKEHPSYQRYASGYLPTPATMRYFIAAYQPEVALRSDSSVSPLRETDLSRSAPAYIAVAECDVLHDEGEAYAQRLRQAGVKVQFEDVPGVMHGFVSLLGFKEGRDCLKRGAQWLHQQLTFACVLKD